MKFVAQKAKKVAIQRNADSHQQVGVKAVFPEKAIDIGSVKTKLICEPSNGTLLSLEFLSDQLSELYHCLNPEDLMSMAQDMLSIYIRKE